MSIGMWAGGLSRENPPSVDGCLLIVEDSDKEITMLGEWWYLLSCSCCRPSVSPLAPQNSMLYGLMFQCLCHNLPGELHYIWSWPIFPQCSNKRILATLTGEKVYFRSQFQFTIHFSGKCSGGNFRWIVSSHQNQ